MCKILSIYRSVTYETLSIYRSVTCKTLINSDVTLIAISKSGKIRSNILFLDNYEKFRIFLGGRHIKFTIHSKHYTVKKAAIL